MSNNAPILDIFPERGELLRIAKPGGRYTTHGLAIDRSAATALVDDAYQAGRLRGTTIGVHGVFANSTRLWRHEDELVTAAERVLSIYVDAPEHRVLYPMFDRELSLSMGLQEGVLNDVILARAKIGPKGEVYSCDFSLASASIERMTAQEFGEKTLKKKRGRIVTEVASRAIQNIGHNYHAKLEPQENETLESAAWRVGTMSLNAFSGLFSNIAAQQAFLKGYPWIYKSTDEKTGKMYYTTEPSIHSHVDDVFCQLTPGLRSIAAMVNQAIIVYITSGGDPNTINADALKLVVERINEVYGILNSGGIPKSHTAETHIFI